MTNTTQKVQRRANSSGSSRMYITTPYRICELPSAGFDQPFDPKKQVDFEYIGDDGQLIVKELMADAGVSELFLLGEVVFVEKEARASWRDVEPHVKATLEAAMGSPIEFVSDRTGLLIQSRQLANA